MTIIINGIEMDKILGKNKQKNNLNTGPNKHFWAMLKKVRFVFMEVLKWLQKLYINYSKEYSIKYYFGQ